MTHRHENSVFGYRGRRRRGQADAELSYRHGVYESLRQDSSRNNEHRTRSYGSPVPGDTYLERLVYPNRPRRRKAKEKSKSSAEIKLRESVSTPFSFRQNDLLRCAEFDKRVQSSCKRHARHPPAVHAAAAADELSPPLQGNCGKLCFAGCVESPHSAKTLRNKTVETMRANPCNNPSDSSSPSR